MNIIRIFSVRLRCQCGRFYEQAEAHRNANEGKAEWIKFYQDEFGIELFDAARLGELRELIEAGKALARRRSASLGTYRGGVRGVSLDRVICAVSCDPRSSGCEWLGCVVGAE